MRLTESVEHRSGNVDISPLVSGANIVNTPRPTLIQRQQNRPAVVLNIDPIADVAAISIDGDGVVLKRVRKHEGKKLLGKLPWSIVVAASRDDSIEPERMAGGTHQVLGRGFVGGVRTVRGDGGMFRKV